MPTLIDMRIKSYWQIKRYAQTWGYKSINIQRCRRFRETQISRCRQRHVSCKLYLYKLGTSWACYGWMLLELFYFLSTLEVYLGRCFKQDRVALRSPLLTRIKEALHDPRMILLIIWILRGESLFLSLERTGAYSFEESRELSEMSDNLVSIQHATDL